MTRSRRVSVRTPDGIREMTDGGDIDLDREILHDSAGRRIDEAYVAAAVEEIERRPGPGRPSLSGNRPGASRVVRGRVPDSLHAAFVERAQAEHKSESDVLREALEAYLR